MWPWHKLLWCTITWHCPPCPLRLDKAGFFVFCFFYPLERFLLFSAGWMARLLFIFTVPPCPSLLLTRHHQFLLWTACLLLTNPPHFPNVHGGLENELSRFIRAVCKLRMQRLQIRPWVEGMSPESKVHELWAHSLSQSLWELCSAPRGPAAWSREATPAQWNREPFQWWSNFSPAKDHTMDYIHKPFSFQKVGGLVKLYLSRSLLKNKYMDKINNPLFSGSLSNWQKSNSEEWKKHTITVI